MPWARKLRRVRLHLDREPGSIEGLLVGRVNGHYRLVQGEALESAGRTHELAGAVMVPRDRVTFLQELP